MNSKVSTANTAKTKKRGNSLLVRLTAHQMWNNVKTCIRINIAVLIIFLAIGFVYINYQASKAIPVIYNATEEEIDIVAAIVENAFDCSYDGISTTHDGVAWLAEIIDFFYTADIPDDTKINIHGQWMDYFYSVSMPYAQSGEYINITFDLYPAISVLVAGMTVLAGIEILFIVFGVSSIMRSTRKILRPINELTAAAQNINSQPTPPRPEVLKLTGAIDTLNTITEDHLDKRILIDDEREELKGLASAINAMLDRLDAAYQAQLRFVSDASHELRTPISVIQGYANLLDRWGKRDEKALQESIDAIKVEAEGMESLVEQLLFLARSDNNSIKLEMADIDISVLAEEVLKETEMIDKNHIISGKIDSGIYVYGDSQLIKQAMRVFVDNAIKYTPDNGRIKLSLEKHAGEARISVTDTGIGIADKDISQVFERFFRADESRTRKTGGTGLGLSIAQYIVDSHGGYMEIVSRENIGTKITAVIPEKIIRAVESTNHIETPENKSEPA